VLEEAVRRWAASGLVDAEQLLALEGVRLEVEDLPDLILGRSAGSLVQIDATAADHGWFVDATPGDDAEFGAAGADGEQLAEPAGPAAGAIDLLTVVTHELGHVLGLDPHALTGETLDAGVREIPAATPVDGDVREYAIRVLLGDEEDEDDELSIREIVFA
jgi:hypothetical protein